MAKVLLVFTENHEAHIIVVFMYMIMTSAVVENYVQLVV